MKSSVRTPDWNALTEEATRLLAEYVRLDTTNPPGNEALACDWLAAILDAAYLTAHAALPHLLASGAGAIINMGGMSAHTGAKNRAHVVAAKTGIVGLTRALAHDLAANGVTVNCVVPGMIATTRGGSAPQNPDHHKDHAPLVGRRGRPEEVARLVRYLAGPDARYMTGQTLHASGGVFMP